MSVKKNFIYSALSGTMQYIVTLVTFPYVSRILGVSNIGLVNFVDNTINYFLLFAMMGINLLGIREIAKTKNKPNLFRESYSNLLFIQGVFTFLILILYFIAIFTIGQFRENADLFLIGSAKIIFSFFLIDWFYKGIENFKYITIRNIVIRIVYIITIFLFVKNKDDSIIYFSLTIGTVVINGIINYTYSLKFVRFSFKDLSIKTYLKPFLSLGIYVILTSMYTTFNVVYLGFVSNNDQVGFYTTALKIYTIILGLFSAFTGVMLPRMSSLLAEKNVEGFQNMLYKSFSFLLLFSFPLAIFCVIFAPQIIDIMAGDGYEGAILPMRIIMPLLIVVGLAQILAVQILIPMRKDKVILFASILGAIVGLVSNVIFVNKFQGVGTAFVLIVSESIVSVFYIIKVQKLGIKIPYRLITQKFLLAIPYFLICLSIYFLHLNKFATLSLGLILCFIYFIILEFFIDKNPILLNIKNMILRKYNLKSKE